MQTVPSSTARRKTSANLTGVAESTGSEPVFAEEIYATVNGGSELAQTTGAAEDVVAPTAR